ncbi:MAG: anaerobic ribonucleoside-triphosphate reductase activating protein [Eubacteriales bacterium]|nr:anaerobic ribonucleoside-triphosphate reductase activating protein [Eubacteriales bacterium]
MPHIHGLNKTTLLDYPGRVAATIFLGGCNFRCPFCQNSSLVLHPSMQPEISEEEVLTFLKKRTGILEGVCISGGEPTLSTDLEDFIQKIRQLGYPVKLDTNGSHPEILKNLAGKDLIQMAAVDIKACRENYPSLTGLLQPDLDAVQETVDFLLHGNLDYEFRTTVVRELHNEEDFLRIGTWLKGAKTYYLQAYKDSDEVLQPGFSSYSLAELEHFRDILLKNISKVEIRGID